MKKLIIMVILVASAWFAPAQTDFRSLTYEEAIAAAKAEQGLNELSLNRDGKYAAALKLIKSHAAGELNAYLDVCRKEYSRLTSEQRYRLNIRFSSVITTEDKEVRTKAAKFLRARLADMPADELIWVAMELQNIEGKNGH